MFLLTWYPSIISRQWEKSTVV